jgi:MoaA/NifB/PqqE/SkfB family radical SAM enzyme
MFDSPTSIRSLHLEITERCNAACPLCLRTNPEGLQSQPYISNQELLLADMQRFFPPEVCAGLTEVHFCGSYGDPILAKECMEIVDFFSSEHCEVSLSTNGGARGSSWWTELGGILARHPRSRVDFHIDGLGDTNSFYRRHTNFNKIIGNARAFIAAGGNANWEFIPFKHNEHQVEEARELSRQLGFKRFTIKKSNWGVFNNEEARISFTDRAGDRYYLEPPSEKYRPARPESGPGAAESVARSVRIGCKVKLKREIYISCEGIVYPCCWTARYGRDIYRGRKTRDGFSELFKMHDGRRLFNIRTNDLATMLESAFFQDLVELWAAQEPPVCFKKCGRNDQPEKVRLPNP